MTREEKTNALVGLHAKADELAKAYNEAMQESKIDDSVKIAESITTTVNEYTAMIRGMCFDDCKSADDPMLAAVTKLSFVTIGVRDEKVEGSAIPVRTIVAKERQIDLLALHKYCESGGGNGIGADPNWGHIAMKMNMLLTAQKAKDLGLNPETVNDSYSMSEIAQAINMGKSPTSKTNLLKTLQMVITAMLGDKYKATSHDVNYLMSIYSRKNRAALTVTCANHRHFRNYIGEVCHRIVTGKSYNVDFRKKKESTVEIPLQVIDSHNDSHEELTDMAIAA